MRFIRGLPIRSKNVRRSYETPSKLVKNNFLAFQDIKITVVDMN